MRKKTSGRGLLAFVLILAVLGGAAFFLLGARPVRAGDIRRDPQAFSGKVVKVTGTVVGGASVGGLLLNGGGGFFLLDDGTGQIGVTMKGPVPEKGKRVTVRGPVEVLASVSIPDAVLRGFGIMPGAGDGRLTAVVIRGESVR